MALCPNGIGGFDINECLIEERDHLPHKINIGALCDSLSERGQVKIKVVIGASFFRVLQGTR